MARKLPPHLGKITAAVVAAAVPLIVKAVMEVQKRYAAKAAKAKTARRPAAKRKKSAPRRRKTNSAS